MRNERPIGGAKFVRFIDNHDIANDDYENRIEKRWGSAKVKVSLVGLFTLDGVPFVYNGQEVADTARHSIFGRLPINWANGETPDGKARFAFCQKLCAMRQAERALTHGEVVWLDNDKPEGVLSFLRENGGEKILAVINLSVQDVSVNVKGVNDTFKPLLTEGVKDEKASFELPGYGFFVGKK